MCLQKGERLSAPRRRKHPIHEGPKTDNEYCSSGFSSRALVQALLRRRWRGRPRPVVVGHNSNKRQVYVQGTSVSVATK